jgi:hypothetical protein
LLLLLFEALVSGLPLGSKPPGRHSRALPSPDAPQVSGSPELGEWFETAEMRGVQLQWPSS